MVPMLNAEDNEALTRTGAGTFMGVMDEDLVAFRDTEGRVGLVDPRCAHRGANLFFGRNEECGLRCAYRGWRIARPA